MTSIILTSIVILCLLSFSYGTTTTIQPGATTTVQPGATTTLQPGATTTAGTTAPPGTTTSSNTAIRITDSGTIQYLLFCAITLISFFGM